MLARLICLLLGHQLPDNEPAAGYLCGYCCRCGTFVAVKFEPEQPEPDPDW
jgi:hypothetical protein